MRQIITCLTILGLFPFASLAQIAPEASVSIQLDTTSVVASPVAAAEDTSAQINADEPEIKPGLTPASPWYFLDRMAERMSLMLTFNNEKRTEMALRFAKEKLAETDALNQMPEAAPRIKAMQKAMEQYKFLMENADRRRDKAREMEQKKLEQMKTRGATEEEINAARDRLTEAADERFAKQLDVHRTLLEQRQERLPDAMKDVVKQMHDQTRSRMDSILNGLPNPEKREALKQQLEQQKKEIKQRVEDRREQKQDEASEATLQ